MDNKFEKFRIKLEKRKANGLIVVIDPFQKEKYNNNRIMKEIEKFKKEFNINKEEIKFFMLHELPTNMIEVVKKISPAFIVMNSEKVLLIQRGY